jgi:hypothetical protein
MREEYSLKKLDGALFYNSISSFSTKLLKSVRLYVSTYAWLDGELILSIKLTISTADFFGSS